MNLEVPRGTQVKEAVANGGGERAYAGPRIEQAKCGLGLRTEESGHELADFERGEELALFLAVVERGEAFILGLQVKGVSEQGADSAGWRVGVYGAVRQIAILSNVPRKHGRLGVGREAGAPENPGSGGTFILLRLWRIVERLGRKSKNGCDWREMRLSRFLHLSSGLS
jgi:hypothetical protein